MPSAFTYADYLYLDAKSWKAKGDFIALFLQGVSQRLGSLQGLFGVLIENEAWMDNDRAPFNSVSGTIVTGTGSCDLSSAAAREQCWDSNAVGWANTIKAAVAAVDSQLLVGAGMFTYNAVAKPGPKGLLPLNVADHRFPARVAVLMQYSTLDFLDVHVYPSTQNAAAYLKTDMASEEWAIVRQSMNKKPVLMGEFGAFQSAFPSVIQAADTMRDLQIDSCKSYGFVGWLFWTWDCLPSEGCGPIWNMMDQGMLLTC
jgi:hypothetical protein